MFFFFLSSTTTTTGNLTAGRTAAGQRHRRPLAQPPLLLPPPPSSFYLPYSPPSKHRRSCMSLDHRQQHHRQPPSAGSHPITLLLPFPAPPKPKRSLHLLPAVASVATVATSPATDEVDSIPPQTNLSPTSLCTSQLLPRLVPHQFSTQPPALVMSACPFTAAATSHAGHFPPVRHPSRHRLDPTTLLLSLPLPFDEHLPTCLTGVLFGAIPATWGLRHR